MLIEKYEQIKEQIYKAIEEGELNLDIVLELINEINKIDKFIEENEIFYYVNKLKEMINALERRFLEELI